MRSTRGNIKTNTALFINSRIICKRKKYHQTFKIRGEKPTNTPHFSLWENIQQVIDQRHEKGPAEHIIKKCRKHTERKRVSGGRCKKK